MSMKIVKGVSFPISFDYNYRGKHYCELDMYFSFAPISTEHRDLLEPGMLLSKGLQHLLKRGPGIFDALIPCKTEEINTSESIGLPRV